LGKTQSPGPPASEKNKPADKNRQNTEGKGWARAVVSGWKQKSGHEKRKNRTRKTPWNCTKGGNIGRSLHREKYGDKNFKTKSCSSRTQNCEGGGAQGQSLQSGRAKGEQFGAPKNEKEEQKQGKKENWD